MNGNRCPVCLKEFATRQSVLDHMRSLGHTIDGHKSNVKQSDEARMALYHAEKTRRNQRIYRYGK